MKMGRSEVVLGPRTQADLVSHTKLERIRANDRTGGMMKLFLHEILPSDVDRAIFIDTDAMLIVDPYREYPSLFVGCR